ncbi:hypothetical protein QUB56_24500 [Microcoleus sp. AR_TQ3_B6]|uniref:hypothetical protein n=1 Tax=Microcoleus sp. AR_TQ3_B6 TaxID=3055284 RepID=UPI002FD5F6BC
MSQQYLPTISNFKNPPGRDIMVNRSHMILDRDRNAALNILAKGLRQAGADLNTVGHIGINAWGHTHLYSWLVTSASKLTD